MFEPAIGQAGALILELREITSLLERGDVNSLLDIFSAEDRTQNLASLLPLEPVYQTIGDEVASSIRDTGFRLRESFGKYFVRFECFEVLYRDFDSHIPLVKLDL